MSLSLAIVEDDIDLRENLTQLMRSNGYRVWAVDSAEAFYRQMVIEKADIILVDVGLPGEDGISLIHHVRDLPHMGLVVLTCHDDPHYRAAAYEAGANVFLTKPVQSVELLAVVRSLARRMNDTCLPVAETDPVWELNMIESALVAPDGRKVALTGRQLSLLGCLMAQAGERVSKEDVQAYLGNIHDYQTVATLLSRLRKRVEEELGVGLPIRAIFGQGLVFHALTRLKKL